MEERKVKPQFKTTANLWNISNKGLKIKFYLISKRLCDIVFAIIGLLVLLLVAITIKLIYVMHADYQSIFFHQQRVGKNGQLFTIYKLRTMVVGADVLLKNDPQLNQLYVANDYKIPIEQDPRVTKVGIFLRKWSLDELPQFWNILKGEMSLIGPRPLVPSELRNYRTPQRIKQLLSMRPGIVGYWQACGRSNIPYPRRCSLELYYVKNASFSFDFWIFWKSIISVIKHVGAY